MLRESYMDDAIGDVSLILLGLLAMTYANLIIFNTGTFVVNPGKTITFSYETSTLALIGGTVLYIVAYGALITVGSSWSSRAKWVGYTAPLVYATAGLLFNDHIFGSSEVRSRVIGGKTDGYVLQTEGARRLIAGKNPYASDYASEIMAQVPGYFRTPLTADPTSVSVSSASNIVTHLDYPPVSVLWYVPAEILGISGSTWDLSVLIALMLIMYMVTPGKIRLLVPVFFLVDWNMILFPAAYIPDMGWVAFTVLALLAFHYPRTSAVAFALAASYRPQPILIATYVGVMAYRVHGLAYIKKWVVTGLVATAVINVPFALWTGPARYWELITIPMSATIPPGGVGPAGFLKAGLIADPASVKPLFTIAVFIVWVATLIISWRYYDELGAGMFAFPGLVLWFHWRSLQNYMLWFPLLVAVVYFTGIPARDPIAVLREQVNAVVVSPVRSLIDTR